MKKSIYLCVFLAVAFYTNNALASIMSFDFTQTTSQTLTATERFTANNGEHLTAQSVITETGQPNSTVLNIGTAGLGVSLVTGSDGLELDNTGPDEGILFSFEDSVLLNTITLSQVGANDDFSLSIDGLLTHFGDIPGGNASDTDITTINLTSNNWTGRQFLLSTFNQYDDFNILSLQVSKTVPEPSAYLLLLLGLTGVWITKRRKI